MTDAIAFISIGTLCVGVVILAVAFLGMRSARRSAELAEHRMEYLREEHDRLVFLREERQSLEEELKRERQERMAAQQKAERAERERPAKLEQDRKLLTEELERRREQRLEAQRQVEELEQDRLQLRQENRQLVEELEQERAAHLEAQHQIRRERSEREQERQARRRAEQKADYLEEECKKLREAKKSGQLDRERIIEDLREASRTLWKRLSPPR